MFCRQPHLDEESSAVCDVATSPAWNTKPECFDLAHVLRSPARRSLAPQDRDYPRGWGFLPNAGLRRRWRRGKQRWQTGAWTTLAEACGRGGPSRRQRRARRGELQWRGKGRSRTHKMLWGESSSKQPVEKLDAEGEVLRVEVEDRGAAAGGAQQRVSGCGEGAAQRRDLT